MMVERPKWVRAIHAFVSDGVFDDALGFPMDGSDDPLHDRIEAALNAVLCGEFGHDIIHDQCGNPDHRYCVWCRTGIGGLERTPKDTIEGEG